MKFYTDPDFVVYPFDCPYCDHIAEAVVHQDGAAFCGRCNVDIAAPKTYEECLAEAADAWGGQNIKLGMEEFRQLIRGAVIEPRPGIRICLSDLGWDVLTLELTQAKQEAQARAGQARAHGMTPT